MADRKPLISRQLEDAPQPLRGDPDGAEAVVPPRRRTDYEAVDVSVHPPFTDLRSVQTVLESDDIPIALGAQHCHWEEQGRVHRRGVAGDAGQAQRLLRHRRSLRATRAVRRDRRDGQRQGEGHPEGGHDADPVLWRDARGARGRAHRGQGARPGPGRPRRASARSRSAGWSSPTSRSGRSAPAGRPVPRTRRRCARSCGPPWRRSPARRRRPACASSTAARSSRRTPPS